MNDDSISRQAVLEKQYRIDDSTTLSTRDVVNVEDIEEMPSVTPTQNCVEKCVGNALDCISRQAVLDCLTARGLKKFDFILDARDKIKNLPSVNPQPCGDAISLETVIEWLKDKDIIKLSSQEEMARKELKALTPVMAEPKTGHWIYTGDYLTEGMLKCSECGEEIDVSESYYDFCPVCGARMESEE